MLHIGCHLSSAKGLCAMGRQALALGADTFQFFTRNPRGSRAKALDAADADALTELLRENRFAPIIAHAPYTLNLCGAAEENRRFAQALMRDDLERMEHIPGQLYNFHPGSHVGQGMETGIAYITDMLNAILKPEQTTTVLLETMAGKGTEVDKSFEELESIISKIKQKENIGVCLDTCHINDAGYDLNYFDKVLDSFDKIIGLDKLKCIHVNDSKNIMGSHKDRHENIGYGYIGFDNLINIIYNKRLDNIPKILETPYIDKTYPPYKYEIEMIRTKKFNKNLIDECKQL